MSDAWINHTLSACRGGQLRACRAALSAGVLPPQPTSGLSADSVVHHGQSNPEARRDFCALMEEGPAAAVDDVEELYAAGLPRGLPGNLHSVALDHRVELLERLAVVRAAKARLPVHSARTVRASNKTATSDPFSIAIAFRKVRRMLVELRPPQ